MPTAERDLVIARRASAASDPGALTLLDAAILAQREHGTPYHLAHGLLEASELCQSLGHADRATALAAESLEDATRLRAAPLVRLAEDRLRALEDATSNATAGRQGGGWTACSCSY